LIRAEAQAQPADKMKSPAVCTCGGQRGGADERQHSAFRATATTSIGTISVVIDHAPDNGVETGAPEPLSQAVQQLLEDWRRMALKASRRHSTACDAYERRDSLYGVASTVLAAIVGSTIFVTLQKTASETIRIIAGLVAAAAAIASGIQTTAKYGQLAERYRQASRHYATVARHIDEVLANPPGAGQIKEMLDELRKSLDDIGAMAPNVPPKIWNATDDGEQRVHFRSHREILKADQPAGPEPGASGAQTPS
jgi:hypothetical protein